MAVLRWPYQIDDIRGSGYIVRKKGLICAPDFWGLPLYPDGVAGTTYKSLPGWTSGVDSWVTEGGFSTVAIVGGYLKSTVNAGQVFNRVARTFAMGTNKTYRARIRLSKAAAANNLFIRVTRGGTPDQTIYANTSTMAANVWHTLGTFEALNVTKIYIQQSSVVEADYFEIEFVYIGDGTYDTKALDASGNGNHGTVYGCTPDGAGGLSFDGVNDYVALAHPSMSAFSYFAWVKRVGTGLTQEVMYGATASTAKAALRIDTSNRITANTYNGTGFDTVTGPVLDTNLHFGGLVFSAGVLSLYVDGVLYGQSTGLTLTSSLFATLNLGRNQITSSNFFSGVMSYPPRIYNRALSASEILALYTDPELYDSIPQYPQQDGFQESPQDGTIRSSMDSGPAKTRQRFTALTTGYHLTYQVDDTQKQILDYFYRFVTRGGSLAFEWPHPVGVDYQARFLRPPTYTPNGPEFVASVALEVLP